MTAEPLELGVDPTPCHDLASDSVDVEGNDLDFGIAQGHGVRHSPAVWHHECRFRGGLGVTTVSQLIGNSPPDAGERLRTAVNHCVRNLLARAMIREPRRYPLERLVVVTGEVVDGVSA
jgi:hypothetical protein